MTAGQQYNAFITLARREVVRVLRIWTQTLLPPAITMGIYFVVFGDILGSRIQAVGNYSYIQYILPGLVLMTTITNSFSNVATSFFSAKFQKSIEELLVAPIPDWLVVAGYVSGGLVRGLLNGLIVMGLGRFFTAIPIAHPEVMAAYMILTTLLFSLLGMINGMLARKFDDVGIIPTFFLTPLTYFAGVFYSIQQLPEPWRQLSLLNPIFYMVDGFRYGFLGVQEASLAWGLGMLIVANVALWLLSMRLYKRGIGLRS